MATPHQMQILERLAEVIPAPQCELDFRNPFELLLATQLSAQSTDAMVNRITPALFARYPDARALSQAQQEDVERLIFSSGFYRNKAKNLIASAKILMDKHGGQVPRTMEALVELPGVARKTANVVLGTAFGIASGITVDTHCHRVTLRLGWHTDKGPNFNAIKIEKTLMEIIPKEQWIDSSHRIVLFGRHHCTARNPECKTTGCRLAELCPVGQGGVDPHVIGEGDIKHQGDL
jgi:endonuclease-3